MALALSQKQVERLASDPVEFDTRVVQSVLELHNQMHSDLGPREWNFELAIDQLFGWVPPTMAAIASRESIPLQVVKWRDDMDMVNLGNVMSVLLFMFGAFRESLEKRGSIGLPNRGRISASRWLDETLQKLAVYSRYRFDGTGVKFVSVPCLTGINQCIAYALTVVKLDKHGLGSRVRACGFLKEDKPSSLAHHLFLADDLRQKFCCPAHSNAQRQRDFKARNQK